MSVGAESLDNHESVAERRSAPERLVAVTSVVGSCVVAVTFRDRITRSYLPRGGPWPARVVRCGTVSAVN
jgi:hypothetical protein